MRRWCGESLVDSLEMPNLILTEDLCLMLESTHLQIHYLMKQSTIISVLGVNKYLCKFPSRYAGYRIVRWAQKLLETKSNCWSILGVTFLKTFVTMQIDTESQRPPFQEHFACFYLCRRGRFCHLLSEKTSTTSCIFHFLNWKTEQSARHWQ